jgi:hypothetical protein
MVKRLFKKPLAAILTIITIVCMLGPTILRMTAMKNEARPELFHAIIGGGILVYAFFLFTAIVSQNSGIFYLPDANLIFTAPIHKKKVLIYAVVGSFMGSVLLSLFVLIMLPMVAGSNIPVIGYLAAGLSIILLMTMLLLVYYYFYLKSTKDGNGVNTLKICNKILMGLLTISLIAVAFSCSWDLKRALNLFFGSNYYNAFPIYGWTKWAVVSALNGQMLSWAIATGINLAFCALIVFGILKTDYDYYEQAISDAQKIQSIKNKATSGQLDAQSFYTKKIRKAKVDFKEGAKAIWSRQILEMKKSNIGRNNTSAFISVFYVIIFSLIMDMDFKGIAVMITVMTMATSMNEVWNKDFKKPFIYLIPENSLAKAFYATLSSLIKSILSGIPAFLILYILKSPTIIELVLMYAIYVSYMPLFLYSAVFAQRLAGSQSNLFIVLMIRMLAVIISSVPSAVLFVVLQALSGSTTIGAMPTLISIVINIAMSLLLLAMSKRVFEVAELMD